MHFSTFLKLLTLDSGDKIRQLENYAKPGGFDFYRSSRDAVLNYWSHGKSRESVIDEITKSAPQNAISHNIEIFDNVASWLDKQSGEKIAPSRGVWTSPSKIFSVHIQPEIGLKKSNQQRILAVYPRRDPRLNRDQAGAGLLLLKKAYRGTGEEDFGVLDAYGQKAYWSPTNVSSTLLDLEVRLIESELKRIMG